MSFVPVIMGSKSDLTHGQRVIDALKQYGIDGEIRVASAHKAPTYLLDLLKVYEADPRDMVYITIAGRSNALSALTDSRVRAPVIACPPYSDKFGGADLFSSLRMPSGIAPAVVLDPGGAALVAAKIFGVSNPEIRQRVAAHQQALEDRIKQDDAALNGTAA